MDALELALHCSGLMRPLPRSDLHDSSSMEMSADTSSTLSQADASLRSHTRMDETECERHFKLCGMFLEAVIVSVMISLVQGARETKSEMQICI